MFNKIKDRLRRYFFKTEEVQYKAQIMALEVMKQNANVTSLAREQLKGFDPRSINLAKARDRNFTIYDGLNEEERLALINNIHSLHENPALPILLDFLTQKQLLYGMMEAEDLMAVNCSRLTINGLCLLQDQINEVEGVYKALHSRPEDFNKFEIT